MTTAFVLLKNISDDPPDGEHDTDQYPSTSPNVKFSPIAAARVDAVETNAPSRPITHTITAINVLFKIFIFLSPLLMCHFP